MSRVVLSNSQLECLSSPARNEVFGGLRLLGTATVAELAQTIDRKPQAVHYHLKELKRVGLAFDAGRRPGLRKPQSLFSALTGPLSLPYGDNPESARLRAKAVAAGLRQTLRGFTSAAQRGDLSAQEAHVLRLNLRLSPQNTRRFFEILEEAVEFADAHKGDQWPPLSWHSVVYPLKQPNS